MKRKKHVVRATMKSWFLAVVVLGLISVCQPVSLFCDRLLQPVDNGPDWSGRWYYIAISMDPCVVQTLLTSGFWPSASVDITSTTNTTNIYNLQLKTNGYCIKNTGEFDNTVPTVLQTGCPDCIVAKWNASMNILFLLSRRNNVTAAELSEFKSQIHCLGWNKLELLKMDHDYENCKSDEDLSEADTVEMVSVSKKLKADCISSTW